MAKKKDKKEKKEKKIDPIVLEREIRRYIKPRGGYRKDLSTAKKKIALKLLERVGRTVKDGWDFEMNVPGLNKEKM